MEIFFSLFLTVFMLMQKVAHLKDLLQGAKTSGSMPNIQIIVDIQKYGLDDPKFHSYQKLSSGNESKSHYWQEPNRR